MWLLDWIFAPVIEKETDNCEEETPKKQFDRIKLFRPQYFHEYIGQEKAKNILKSYIQATKKRNSTFPHTIIDGSAGCGKTTVAKIIANELGVKFVEAITSEIRFFEDIEAQIDKAEGGVIFLDEIHSLDRGTAESLYTLMEDFTYRGEAVQPFTLIGATTELGELLKNRKPFVDRFELPIELEDYTCDEMVELIMQFKDRMFPEDYIAKDTFMTVAANCRSTPRVAIRLLKATIYLEGDIKQVLYNFGIIKEGFTTKDLKVLNYLTLNEKGIGVQAMSSYLGTSTENYTQIIEPYLMKKHLIIRTSRGRKITDEGVKKLGELR